MSKLRVISLILALGGSALAQQFAKLIGTTDQLDGWALVPRTNITENTRIVADFNGDGYDDIFWFYVGQTASQTAWTKRIWTFDAAGSPKLFWNGDADIDQLVTSGVSIDLKTFDRLIAGNFTGGPEAELILYAPLFSTPGIYYMINWSAGGATPLLLTQNATSKIGNANMVNYVSGVEYRTRFFAANVTGSVFDELVSIERTGPNAYTIRVQQYDTTLKDFVQVWGTVNQPNFGGWYINWDDDEFYFGDFIISNNSGGVRKELLCVNRANGWMKVMEFVGTGWQDRYANMGNANVFANPSPANTYPFDKNTVMMLANWDADANEELLLYQSGSPDIVTSIEFDQTATPIDTSHPPISLAGISGNTQSSSPVVTAFERWTTQRYCKRRFLGICVQWTGGQTFVATRQFYGKTLQDTFDVLHGNFAGAVGPNPAHEIIVFYGSSTFTPNIPSNAWFLTSCGTDTMYSGSCAPDLDIYNLAGALINKYNRPSDTFSKQVISNNTRWGSFFTQGNF